MFALGFVQMGLNQICPQHKKKGNGALDFW
jgi:hypothetical protein